MLLEELAALQRWCKWGKLWCCKPSAAFRGAGRTPQRGHDGRNDTCSSTRAPSFYLTKFSCSLSGAMPANDRSPSVNRVLVHMCSQHWGFAMLVQEKSWLHEQLGLRTQSACTNERVLSFRQLVQHFHHHQAADLLTKASLLFSSPIFDMASRTPEPSVQLR